MKLVPFYFFLALFIGFLIIYTYKYDYHIIFKNKKCIDDKCYNI